MALAFFVFGTTTGCAGSGTGGAERPAYVEPEPGGKGRATLRGAGGVYIQGVDGARVVSADKRVSHIGGNVVIVSAGLRQVRIKRHGKSWDFDFNREKGHTYEFAAAGPFDGRLKVTDKTIGESLFIAETDVAAAW